MKKVTKAIVTLTVKIDYTDMINEMLIDGIVKTREDIIRELKEEAGDGLACHLFQYTDIDDDLTFEIKGR
jgi:hypothetical protein